MVREVSLPQIPCHGTGVPHAGLWAWLPSSKTPSLNEHEIVPRFRLRVPRSKFSCTSKEYRIHRHHLTCQVFILPCLTPTISPMHASERRNKRLQLSQSWVSCLLPCPRLSADKLNAGSQNQSAPRNSRHASSLKSTPLIFKSQAAPIATKATPVVTSLRRTTSMGVSGLSVRGWFLT